MSNSSILNRSSFIAAVASVILAASTFGAQNTQGSKSDIPNVLFIAVDDLNDWVNCMGGRKGVHTPNIDRLAARGMLFTNAHCDAPACNPSRVAIMTGVRPASSGIYNNGQDWRASTRLSKAITLPEHFRANGYRAIGGGKIFHALSWIKGGYGKQQNDPTIWDAYYPSLDKPMPDAFWPEEVNAKVSKKGYVGWKPMGKGKGLGKRPAHFFDWGSFDEKDSVTADHKVVDWACGELESAQSTPFFQAVGIFRPHIPWFAPAKDFAHYPINEVFLPPIREDDLDDMPKRATQSLRRSWQKWMVENDEWRNAVQAYMASITFADRQLGRLLDALDASPHAKNTIIVLWSDHGMHIGEKEQWEKFTLWEESTRVPLIIVAPGVTETGGRCSRAVNLLDIYPTLNELCGLPPRDDLEGQSLVPLLNDPNRKWKRPALTTWGCNNHALRTDRWRYIRYSDGSEELYDHHNDPDEFTNLVQSDPDAAKAVTQKLQRWFPKVNVKKSR